MFSTKKTRGIRAIIAGALLAGTVAIGAVADTASAAPDAGSYEAKVVQVDLTTGGDPGPMSMRSGIRW